MAHQGPVPFETLERRAQAFAIRQLKGACCPACLQRALLHAAVGLSYDTGTLPEVRAMMESLLNASAQDVSDLTTH
jgi:hypothetical protein